MQHVGRSCKLNILGEIETSKRVKPITTEVLIGVNKKSLLNSIEGIVFVHKFLPKWNDTFAPNNRILKRIFSNPVWPEIINGYCKSSG